MNTDQNELNKDYFEKQAYSCRWCGTKAAFGHASDCIILFYEKALAELADAESAVWRVAPNTHTIPIHDNVPDPFEGPGETFADAYQRVLADNKELVHKVDALTATLRECEMHLSAYLKAIGDVGGTAPRSAKMLATIQNALKD